MRLAPVDGVAQGEAAPGGHQLLVREGVNLDLLADFTQQHRQPVRRIQCAHLRPSRDSGASIEPETSTSSTVLARQLRATLQRRRNIACLELRLQLRSVARRRDKAERQNTLGPHASPSA